MKKRIGLLVVAICTVLVLGTSGNINDDQVAYEKPIGPLSPVVA